MLGSVGPGSTSGSRGDDLARGRKKGIISIMGVPEPRGGRERRPNPFKRQVGSHRKGI